MGLFNNRIFGRLFRNRIFGFGFGREPKPYADLEEFGWDPELVVDFWWGTEVGGFTWDSDTTEELGLDVWFTLEFNWSEDDMASQDQVAVEPVYRYAGKSFRFKPDADTDVSDYELKAFVYRDPKSSPTKVPPDPELVLEDGDGVVVEDVDKGWVRVDFSPNRTGALSVGLWVVDLWDVTSGVEKRLAGVSFKVVTGGKR